MTNRLSLPLGLALLLVVAACTSVPYTGRRQLRLIGPEEEARMGLEAWREVLGKATVVRGTPEAEMVETVGRRIAAATGERYAWEFALLEGDDTVNAFCLPGGKVAVYTGLLPVTQTPDGLAAVLGHEVAHAVAHHGAERVSQELIAKGVMSAAGASLAGQEPLVREAVLRGLGLGAQVGALLPYSRVHEFEADEIGLRTMIRAGYDPTEAVRLWERMAARGGDRPPTLLATHPEPAVRARRIREEIPRIVA